MIISLKSLAAGLISLSILGCGVSAVSRPSDTNPRIVSAKEVPRIVQAIPTYTHFSYSGVAFFNGKLYSSSNIGLLECDGGTLSRLYKWYDHDDVISGPWYDRANQSLWVFHNGINKLIHFDGKAWGMTDLPKPKEGYSRGDMLNGFQGISTDTAFWFQGGGHAWRWDSINGVWLIEAMPADGTFVSMAPIKDSVFVIMRNENAPYLPKSLANTPEKADSDAIYFFQKGQWQKLPNKLGIKFTTTDIVVGKEAAYILSEEGKLLRLSSSEIAPIETPGEVEAMTVTSSGNLLVSFRNNGIYEFAEGWHKRFACPYPATEAKHWTRLSESNGQVASAIESKPQMAGENQWKYPGQTTLWISSGTELKTIPLGER